MILKWLKHLEKITKYRALTWKKVTLRYSYLTRIYQAAHSALSDQDILYSSIYSTILNDNKKGQSGP